MPELAKRHQRSRARRKGIVSDVNKPVPQEYMLVHPTAAPDRKKEFAGQKTYTHNGKYCVRLTPRQARFYLDQGAIAPIVTAPKVVDAKASEKTVHVATGKV